jgi:perosamine synthetase
MIPRRWVDLSAEEEARIHQWLEDGTEEDTTLIRQWENRIADYAGVTGAAAVSSGRRGMTCIFEKIGLGPGDEVIVPAWTLGELIPLIQGFGAKLIPADIDPATFNMTPESVARRITPATRAVLAVHLFGAPCDIPGIEDAAKGIPIIEDCAHALGAAYQGMPAGGRGYAGFYSFETTKPVNTFGGGMVVSNDESLIEAIRAENREKEPDYTAFLKKIRSNRTEQRLFSSGLAILPLYLLASPTWKNMMNRLYRSAQQAARAAGAYTPVQARFGMERFDALPDRIARRAALVKQYRDLLNPEIRLQQMPADAQTAWYFLVVMLPVAAEPVRLKLLKRGIDAGVGHEIMDDCAALLGYNDCPNVAACFGRALHLPLYETLTPDAVTRIAETLNRITG